MNNEEKLFLKLKHNITISPNGIGSVSLSHKNLPPDFFIWAGYAYMDEEDARVYVHDSFRMRLANEEPATLENEILEKIYEYNSRRTDIR